MSNIDKRLIEMQTQASVHVRMCVHLYKFAYKFLYAANQHFRDT